MNQKLYFILSKELSKSVEKYTSIYRLLITMGTDIFSHSLTQIYFSTLFPSHASHLQHGFASQFEVGIFLQKDFKKRQKETRFRPRKKQGGFKKKSKIPRSRPRYRPRKKSSFQLLGFFFYKFQPLADSRLIAKGSQKDDKRIAD